MAPPKITSNQSKQSSTAALMRTGVVTRNKNAAINNPVLKSSIMVKDLRIKRKAEVSPIKDKNAKRSALGNITNALGKSLGAQLQEQRKATKRVTAASKAATQTRTAQTLVKTTTAQPLLKAVITNTLAKDIKQDNASNVKPKILPRAKQEEEKKVGLTKAVKSRQSTTDLEKSDESSLYVSALEDISDDSAKKATIKDDNAIEKKILTAETIKVEPQEKVVVHEAPPVRKLPEGVLWDFDAENWQDPYQVSQYAMDIFNYLKDRESLFPIGDYIEKQVCLSKWMRSLLVDWMVEVQESFELNHETLYLAVKLVDLYLTKVTVGKETLQLLGAASLFIASKFDERIPPMVEDFLYICDGAYSQRELIRMEINVLKVIDFDLGIPLSYRFLRRYARCAKVSMPTLTLARYILEYSLMDYATIRYSDSKMAAAALLLALYMKDLGDWNATLEYYTGYKLSDIRDIVHVLNQGLHRKHKEALATVRNKYSHKIFYEVAKVPLKELIHL